MYASLFLLRALAFDFTLDFTLALSWNPGLQSSPRDRLTVSPNARTHRHASELLMVVGGASMVLLASQLLLGAIASSPLEHPLATRAVNGFVPPDLGAPTFTLGMGTR